MAETPQHRDNLAWLIEMLRIWYHSESMVYVSGNMFIYYVPGNNRKHVSPDVFVTKGISKQRIPERDYYLVWEENKGPDLVIELTSSSTKNEDIKKKFQLYQDTLKVKEYFLFDPYGDYLIPPLKGYRLSKGRYVPIRSVNGRLPSEVLGLHLERQDWKLRLYDPDAKTWLPTPEEVRESLEKAEIVRRQAEDGRQRADEERQQAENERDKEKNARVEAEAEVDRLKRELEELREKKPRKA